MYKLSKIYRPTQFKYQYKLSKELPALFKIHMHSTLKYWRHSSRNMGVFVGNNTLLTLHLANDQVIFAEDEDNISYVFTKVDKKNIAWGLSINMEKEERRSRLRCEKRL